MKSTRQAIRELTPEEAKTVTGGAFNDWQSGGIAVMGLGLAGGPATAAFAIPISFAMFGLGSYKKVMSL